MGTVRRAQFADRKLFVAPGGKAELQAKAWEASRPRDAARMRQLAARSQVRWFGNWDGPDEYGAVSRHLDKADALDQLAPICLYWAYRRDIDSKSAGGPSNPADYPPWIGIHARALRERGRGKKKLVLLEPDCLSMLDRLPASDQAIRITHLSEAIQELEEAGAVVYVCAGSSNWIRVPEIVRRLRLIGAHNFALNISGTQYLSDENGYGQAIRAGLGFDAGYVIDTSRNGLGPDPDIAWLNPEKRGCGRAPNLKLSQVVSPGLDGTLYVKTIGASDGEEKDRGYPPAGKWMAEKALELANLAQPPFPRV